MLLPLVDHFVVKDVSTKIIIAFCLFQSTNAADKYEEETFIRKEIWLNLFDNVVT